MLVILEIFNKQFLFLKKKILIDNFNFEKKELLIKKILLIKTSKETKIGYPYINNAVALLKVKFIKTKRIKILKFKRRKRYSINKIHKKRIFEITIKKIINNG